MRLAPSGGHPRRIARLTAAAELRRARAPAIVVGPRVFHSLGADGLTAALELPARRYGVTVLPLTHARQHPRRARARGARRRAAGTALGPGRRRRRFALAALQDGRRPRSSIWSARRRSPNAPPATTSSPRTCTRRRSGRRLSPRRVLRRGRGHVHQRRGTRAGAARRRAPELSTVHGYAPGLADLRRDRRTPRPRRPRLRRRGRARRGDPRPRARLPHRRRPLADGE